MTFTELQPALVDLDRTDKLRVMQFLASELVKEQSSPAAVTDNGAHSPYAGKHEPESALDPTAEALIFYKAELRPILEPIHDGEDVAIHVETRTYEVAKGVGHAYRAMRAKQPDGFIVVHRIGGRRFRVAGAHEGRTAQVSPIIGQMDGFPWIEIQLRSRQDERTVRLLIDTGFDGELAIPQSFLPWMGAPTGSCNATFASGEEQTRGLVSCQVVLDDRRRTCVAMYIDGDNPLIGLDLLKGMRVTIDVEDGGEVVVEEM